MHGIQLILVACFLAWYITIARGQYYTARDLHEKIFKKRDFRSNNQQQQHLRDFSSRSQSLSDSKRADLWMQRFGSSRTYAQRKDLNALENNRRDWSRYQHLRNFLQQSLRAETDGISYTRPIENPKCGRTQTTPKFEGRIVGGHEAVPHSWPWQVLFEAGGTCGGTLINAEYVLTAAHCIGTKDLSEITITAGLHSLEQNENTETTRQVRQAQQVIVHPGYNSDTSKNDLALVRLAEPVEFNENVQPACLPGPDPKPDSEVVLIGWGVTSTGGELSPVLKQTEVQVIDHCDQHWAEVDDATQLCFKDKTLTSASCQGDSGGPALQKHEGQWVVEGVTSFGHETCEIIQHGLPDVYTRVSAFLPWIHSVINQ
ncbi:unnamed protein product [Rotaria magnacalcarata]|uniref:Peptidase S1 domain-containing protein n=3 Tax=Rotaria magnacalcarata TaxID=392030 RepID=A0A816X707_9BILA|nr:unnamed protein product [Rotaria magnacalcarata]